MDSSTNDALTNALESVNITEPEESAVFHEFSANIMDQPIFFLVTKLGRSLYLWIGTQEGVMDDLAFSASTPYDKGLPASTRLMGGSGDTTSTAIAARLTVKLNKPIFISLNVVTRDGTVVNEIERRLMEEIKLHPTKF